MVAAAMITMAVVTLTLARRPAPLVAAEAEDAQPVATALPPTTAGVAIAPVIAPQAIRESSAKAAVPKPEKNRIAESATPAAAVAAIDEALGKIDPTDSTPEPAAASEPISAEPAPVSPDPRELGAVTVTGCLETSGNATGFRLTDTEGGDAPKSRSWRTGFLKKHSTSVALVDPPDLHALQAQVGQRVSATGVLTNRELRVSSLRVVGPRCN